MCIAPYARGDWGRSLKEKLNYFVGVAKKSILLKIELATVFRREAESPVQKMNQT